MAKFTQVVTFETQDATFKPPLTREPGQLVELDLTSNALNRQGKLSRGGVPFDIITNEKISGGLTKPLDFGTRSIDPFFNYQDNTPFRFEFDVGGIKSVGLQVGDYGDDADRIVLKAFSEDGALLGEDIANLRGGGRAFTETSLVVDSQTGADIAYIEFIGGSTQFPNSVFYDNIYYGFEEINFSDPTKFSTNIPTESPLIKDPIKLAETLSKIFSLFAGTSVFKNGFQEALTKEGLAEISTTIFNIPGLLSSLGVGLDAAKVSGQTLANAINLAVSEGFRPALQSYINNNQNQFEGALDLEIRNNQENFTQGSATDDQLYLSGQAGNDTLEGGEGYDALYGDKGNDLLIGDDGSDVLNGNTPSIFSNEATSLGADEVDTLTGGAGIDFYVLGDANSIYYNDEDATTSGTEDYALISDFNVEEDFIVLKEDSSDYIFETTETGVSIYLDNDGQTGLSSTDELIAQLEEVTELSPVDLLVI
jgi:Ca2+-binding RTX toxin-like protein